MIKYFNILKKQTKAPNKNKTKTPVKKKTQNQTAWAFIKALEHQAIK